MYRNNFERHMRLVASATTLPAEVTDLRARYAEFRRITEETPILDRIVEGLTTAPGADLPALWAGALAESGHSQPHRNDVLEAIRVRVNEHLRDLYSRCAGDVYRELAQRFDTTAAELTKAAQITDPEADAESLIAASEKQRRAWTAAAEHAAALTQQLPALGAAATLAGLGDGDPDILLPLCVDVTGQDRAALWQAWDTDSTEELSHRRAAAAGSNTGVIALHSRTHRWGALLALGAPLRAHPADRPFEVFPRREPQPAVDNIQLYT